MRLIAFLAVILTVGPCCWGTLPTLDPVDEAFTRFAKLYPQRADELLKEARRRFPRSDENAEAFRALEKYLSNLGQDDIPGLHRAFGEAKAPSSKALAWLDSLATDLTGFRRTFDSLVIEESARQSGVVDKALLTKMRALWEDEYYFSWRFREVIRQSFEQ